MSSGGGLLEHPYETAGHLLDFSVAGIFRAWLYSPDHNLNALTAYRSNL